MDGNGRWATSRGLPRVAGHGEGVKAARAASCGPPARVGVRYLTLYAFSTENWKRPHDEVSTLMRAARGVDLAGAAGADGAQRAVARHRPAARGAAAGAAGHRSRRARDAGQHRAHAAAWPSTTAAATSCSTPSGRWPRRVRRGRARARGHRRGARQRRALHRRGARPGSADPHQRRDAHLELPAVADRLHRALDDADPVAGFRRRAISTGRSPISSSATDASVECDVADGTAGLSPRASEAGLAEAPAAAPWCCCRSSCSSSSRRPGGSSTRSWCSPAPARAVGADAHARAGGPAGLPRGSAWWPAPA